MKKLNKKENIILGAIVIVSLLVIAFGAKKINQEFKVYKFNNMSTIEKYESLQDKVKLDMNNKFDSDVYDLLESDVNYNIVMSIKDNKEIYRFDMISELSSELSYDITLTLDKDGFVEYGEIRVDGEITRVSDYRK